MFGTKGNFPGHATRAVLSHHGAVQVKRRGAIVAVEHSLSMVVRDVDLAAATNAAKKQRTGDAGISSAPTIPRKDASFAQNLLAIVGGESWKKALYLPSKM